MNSEYWINKIMYTMFCNKLCDFYLGLSSTAPLADGTGVAEPAGNGYSRVHITQFTEPANGEVKNASVVLFPQSTNEWFPASSMATHWVLYDGAGSDANLLASGELAEPVLVSIDMTVKVPVGGISITLSDVA